VGFIRAHLVANGKVFILTVIKLDPGFFKPKRFPVSEPGYKGFGLGHENVGRYKLQNIRDCSPGKYNLHYYTVAFCDTRQFFCPTCLQVTGD